MHLQHKQDNYQVTTVTHLQHKHNTYQVTSHTPTAQTKHLPSNNSHTPTAQTKHLPSNNRHTPTAQTKHLPSNNRHTPTAQTKHLPSNNSHTPTAQTKHLPSNKSSPRFSSEVPWWKYFPENPKLNRKPGTSCWIRCWVAKIACRHTDSTQLTSLQTLNAQLLRARHIPSLTSTVLTDWNS
jgi:hypothetical protein